MTTQVAVTAPERRGTTRLRDGRRLGWSEWGPADGTPILFCTGAGMSSWLGFGASSVHELRVRLIALDRPGLGRSSPHPAKTLSSWVDDVKDYLQTNGLPSAKVVGFSMGSSFAFALAGAGLADAVAIVSGQDQLYHEQMQPLLHADVKAMVAAAAESPKEFEERFAAVANAEGLWKLVLRMSIERDRELYLSPQFSSAYRFSLREGFSQGARGYARDVLLGLRKWPTEPEEIRVPVTLWYGVEDTSTIHSPDFGEMLANRLPRSSRRAFPKEGSSLLWTRARQILTGLAG